MLRTSDISSLAASRRLRAWRLRAWRLRAWRLRAGRAGQRPGERPASFRSHLTARGAVLGIFLLSLIACLIAAWRDADVLAGLGYCAAGILAPVYVRRAAQLAVLLSAPALFLLAAVISQVVTGQGSSGHAFVLSVLEGTALMLAAVAPWLFAGTAVCAVIALTRGLPECVRQLRASSSLRGAPVNSRSGPRPRRLAGPADNGSPD